MSKGPSSGHRPKRVVAAVAVSLASIAAAAPAWAIDAARGDTYYTPPTPYHNVGNYDPGCRGVDVKLHYDYEGIYSEKNAPGTHGQGFFYKDVADFTETWKNRDSGEVLLTIAGHRAYEEVSTKRVPKSKVPKRLIPKQGLVGPIYWFTAEETGHDTVRDADGDILVGSYGTVIYKQLYDTLGDSKPGGRELKFRVAKVIGPHPDVNLCRVAAQIEAAG